MRAAAAAFFVRPEVGLLTTKNDCFDAGFVAAHVEAEERQSAGEAERDEQAERARESDREVEVADERVRVLTETLLTAKRMFEKGLAVNKDLPSASAEITLRGVRERLRRGLATVDAALALSSLENEEEQK